MSREEDEARYAEQKKQQEQARKNYSFKFNFIMGIFNGITRSWGASPPILIASALWEGVVLLITNYLREKYLDFAASYYQADTPIQTASEREALKQGIQATTYIGYLKSFFYLSTWRHFLAFAAGLQHAVSKNEDVLDNILQRKPRAQRPYAIKLTLSQHRTFRPFTDTHTSFQWITYEDKIDLKRQLQAFLDEYQENTLFFNKTATLSFTKENEGDPLPAFFAKRVALVLADNPCVQKIDNIESLFSPKEVELFKASMQQSQKEEKRQRHYVLRFAALGTLAGAALCFFTAPPLAVTLLTMLTTSALTGGAALMRQSYLSSVASYYDLDTIKEVKEPARIEALQCGVEAASSWSKYFLMNFKYSALRHPIDAQIGMEYGLREHKIAEKIQKLGK